MQIDDSSGTHRLEPVILFGEVKVDLHKCPGVRSASRFGQLQVGMMGVTVLQEDGTAALFPWRVIQWVDMKAPV